MEEKLSVIIPAYNAQAYIPEAICSVGMQEWAGAIEMVVVDDGSTDNTAAVAEKLGTYVIKQAHRGAAGARNAGVRQSDGGLILFLDADDVLTPGALAALYEPMRENDGISAVFGMAEDFISSKLTSEQRRTLSPRRQAYGGVLPGCAILKRHAFETVGYFDETLGTAETVAWQLALRDSDFYAVSIHAVTMRRRLHMTNTGRVQKSNELDDYMAIIRRHLNHS